MDARLIALDAERGEPCPDFGQAGQVDLSRGVDLGKYQADTREYGVTSPPVVIGDLVVVGSAIGDNRAVTLERGIVRAFDARTGAMRWLWDPIPREPADPAFKTWADASAAHRCGQRLGSTLGGCGSGLGLRTHSSPARTITVANVLEAIRTLTQSLRYADPAANWSGITRSCTTTSGTMICPPSRA